MSTVLVIDDEISIRRLLRVSLESQGYAVHEASTAAQGMEMADAIGPDLVLLDLGLPDRDGADALVELRGRSRVLVMVLSVRNSEEEIVKLLESGADDYVVKPFNSAELVARIKVLIRNRVPRAPFEHFVTGRLEVDFHNRQVSVAGRPVRLTPTEYDLMRILVRNGGQVVTHRQLLREVWGPHAQKETNYLHVYITSLRKKIESNPQFPQLLLTQAGVGYKLVVLPAEAPHGERE